MKDAKLFLDSEEYELPVVVGSEGEVAVDVRSLRKQSGAITFDPGYGNTGSCESARKYYRNCNRDAVSERADLAALTLRTETDDFTSCDRQPRIAAAGVGIRSCPDTCGCSSRGPA